MQVLDMEFGYTGDYNLENVFAMNQFWNSNHLLRMQHPRPTSALVYAVGCEPEYEWDGGTCRIKKGEVVYIPQGSTYTTRFVGAEKETVGTILIEFSAVLLNGERFVFSSRPERVSRNNEGISGYFEEMVRLFMSPVVSPSLNKSVLYRLLSSIGYERRTRELFRAEYAPIADGIMYMENDISPEKSIAEIAKMSHVSTSYFRKLFKKYSGMSPAEYRIQVKISHAKRLLKTDTMKISEISDTLGFYDTAYFCRVFKKYTGRSPREYASEFTEF